MLKQQSFVRCVSATLCVGLLSAAVVLGGKVKDPPAPPPPPETSVTYRFVDLGVQYKYIVGLSEGGVVLGHLEYLSGVSYIKPYILQPLLDGDGKPLSWFADKNRDGINDLVYVLPDPTLYLEQGGTLQPSRTWANCIARNGVVWGGARFEGVGNFTTYWHPNGTGGYYAGLVKGLSPVLEVSGDGSQLLLAFGEQIAEVTWAEGGTPSVNVSQTGLPQVGGLLRVNERRDVMWQGGGDSSAILIISAGTDSAVPYVLDTRDISYGYDMNASGVVVGMSATSMDGFLKEVWPTMWYICDGTLVSIDLPASGRAYGINDIGQVVGGYGTSAYLYEEGKATTLNSIVSNSPSGDLRPQAIANDGIILVERWVKVKAMSYGYGGLLVPVTP